MADDNLIHPYYNHNYARYDLDINDVIAGLKKAGYNLDGEGGVGGSGDDDNEGGLDNLDSTLRLEVLSTRGTRCNTTAFNTILYPRLYKNNIDITDSIPPTNFKWRRVSGNSEASRLEDAEWNLRYAAGSKECYITKEDVKRNSTFTCTYVEFEDQDAEYVIAAYKAYINNANPNGGDN